MVGSFAQRFENWMPFQILVEPFIGVNDYGEHQYAAPIPFPCQIEEKIRRVMNNNGEERVSSTTLYIAGGPIDPRDQITMPVSFKGPNKPPILTVSNVNDITGFSHSEVYL